MRGYGYEPGPGWFPDTKQELERAKTSSTADDNSPRVVLGQMALVLAIALGLALVVNLILFNFDIG